MFKKIVGIKKVMKYNEYVLIKDPSSKHTYVKHNHILVNKFFLIVYCINNSAIGDNILTYLMLIAYLSSIGCKKNTFP
jgi:hypothetical protein